MRKFSNTASEEELSPLGDERDAELTISRVGVARSRPSKRALARRRAPCPTSALRTTTLPAPMAPMIETISPAADVDVDVVHGLEMVVEDAELFDFEQRRGHGRPPTASSEGRA